MTDERRKARSGADFRKAVIPDKAYLSASTSSRMLNAWSPLKQRQRLDLLADALKS